MGLHIIITGDPVTGFQFYGPFATREEAHAKAESLWDAELIQAWTLAPLGDAASIESDVI